MKCWRRAKRASAFVQHSSDVVGVVDVHGVITYVSPSVRVVFGFEPRAAGRPILDLIHPGDLTRARTPSLPRRSPVRERDGRTALPSRRRLVAVGRDDVHEPDARAGGPRCRRELPGRHRAPANRDARHRETQVLEILAGRPIPETLHGLMEAVEEFVGDGSATIRLYDGEATGAPIAAPTLPAAFIAEMDVRLPSRPTTTPGRLQLAFRAAHHRRHRHPPQPQMGELRQLAGAHGSGPSGRCPSARPTTRASWGCWRSTCGTPASRRMPSSR